MSNYIQRLISYFFHHNVSGRLANRVYKRVSSADEKERDTAFLHAWQETEKVILPEKQIEEAYYKLVSSLGITPEPFPAKKAKAFSWYRIAAIWLIPLGILCCTAYFFCNGNKSEEISSEITYIRHYAALGTKERVVLPDSSVV